jgi:hypothetical protein
MESPQPSEFVNSIVVDCELENKRNMLRRWKKQVELCDVTLKNTLSHVIVPTVVKTISSVTSRRLQDHQQVINGHSPLLL